MHIDFGESIAATYDDDEGIFFFPEVVDPVVDFLADLAGDGRVLEVGIGTGRIGLPLARRDVPVHGVELSRAMAARLVAKPGGTDIGLTVGDFATATVDGSFPLAYLVDNTIWNLTTQAAQVACFRNVPAHLEPGASSRPAFRPCDGSRRVRLSRSSAGARTAGGSTSSTLPPKGSSRITSPSGMES